MKNVRTIKGNMLFSATLTVIIFFIISLLLVVRYEAIVEEYQNLTDNISYAEDIIYSTDQLTNDIILVYTEYDPAVSDRILMALNQIETTMSVLEKELMNDSSLFLYERLSYAIQGMDTDARNVLAHMSVNNQAHAASSRDTLTRTNVVVNTLVDDLVKSELSHMQLLRVSLTNELNTTRIQFAGLILIIVAVLAATFFWLYSGMYGNMIRLQDLFREMSKGNLDVDIPDTPAEKEFQILINEALKMKNSLKELNQEKVLSRTALVSAIGSLVETRDSETGEHIDNIKENLYLLCQELKLGSKYSPFMTDDYVNTLIQVAPLHDIGKVGIPDNILLKPGKLTDEEFEVMKKHVIMGQKVIQQAIVIYEGNNTEYFDVAEEIIADHHEKWDGSGYPKGIAGTEISLAGRLVAIIDVYDALTSERVYKRAFSHKKAVDIIEKSSGSHFDPEIVHAFLAIEEKITQDPKMDYTEAYITS